MLKDKTILYIVHKYNSFQKDPIEEASKYFKDVYVLVRYKPFSGIVKYLPFKFLKAFDEGKIIDLKGLPSNVHVIKTPIWYMPCGFFSKLLGNIHYKAVQKVIDDRGIKFDIVHSFFIWSSGFVGMKIKEKYGVPFVVTGHGFDVYSLPFKDGYWKNKTREILDSADEIFTVSAFNKKHLERIEVDSKRITVVNNGFSKETFYPISKNGARKKLGIDEKGEVIISVGNLEKVKGYDVLIKSMKNVIESRPNTKCYIVGDGSQCSVLDLLIKETNLQDNVFLTGAKPHDEIKYWMNSADVFVISSRIESASVVLLEALACGVPVVSTKVGIVPEILNKTSGILVENHSSSQLAISIENALELKWNRKEIANISEEYTWEKAVDKMKRLYDRLI